MQCFSMIFPKLLPVYLNYISRKKFWKCFLVPSWATDLENHTFVEKQSKDICIGSRVWQTLLTHFSIFWNLTGMNNFSVSKRNEASTLHFLRCLDPIVVPVLREPPGNFLFSVGRSSSVTSNMIFLQFFFSTTSSNLFKTAVWQIGQIWQWTPWTYSYLNFVIFTFLVKMATADFEAINNVQKVNKAFLLFCRLWILQISPGRIFKCAFYRFFIGSSGNFLSLEHCKNISV